MSRTPEQPDEGGVHAPATPADPYATRDLRPARRRWVLPVSIAGGVAVVAVGAVIAALLLAPAPKQQAAASPKPTTPASASPSASPKPAAKPAPRIRIDCESVISRADATAYLGSAPVVEQDRATYLPDLAWLQAGGLGCTWETDDRGLRVTAIPLEGVPEVEPFLHVNSDASLPLATMPINAPLIECDPLVELGCGARAANDEVVVYLFDPAISVDRAAFTALATAAIAKIAAAPVAPLWIPPYPLTLQVPPTCEDDIDPAGAIAKALDRTSMGWGHDYVPGDSMDYLVVVLRESHPLRCLAYGSGLPNVEIATGSRWAWDTAAGAELANGATALDVAGAEHAVINTDLGGYGRARLTLVAGDGILQFRGSAPDGVDARDWAVRAAEAWLARYAA